MVKNMEKKDTVDVAQALLKVPALVTAVEKFVSTRQSEVDLLSAFTQIDLDVKTLTARAETNLKQTVDLKEYMVKRLKALDSMEAEWSLLKRRVSTVLGELERVLKRL